MGKKYATIYIEEVIRKAKEIGLNISKTCENALKEAIRRLETPNIQYLNQNNPEKEGQGNVVSQNLVRPPGFEPGLETWEASVLDQSRLRSLLKRL